MKYDKEYRTAWAAAAAMVPDQSTNTVGVDGIIPSSTKGLDVREAVAS
jgi:hypothetical protein